MKNTFVISCPIDTYSGYGARSRDVVKSIIKSDKYDVKILPQRWGNTPWGFIEDHEDWHFLKPHLLPVGNKLTSKPDIWAQITVPNEFTPIGEYNIGFTAGIETDTCAPQWVEGMNRMDLNIVSSNHAKQVFLNSKFEIKNNQTNQTQGMLELNKPIEVLFEGIDLDTYHKTKSKGEAEFNLDIDSIKESFAYLFVGAWLPGSMGEDRKNVSLMIKAFLETFKNKKNKPALILKTSVSGPSYMDRDEVLKRIKQIKNTVNSKNLPNIYLLHGDFSNQEINELYNHPKVKAMISFTKGEGFGRPLLEFSVTGKPIISTNWSGHIDFLNSEFTTLIGGELKLIHKTAQVKDMLIEGSKWFAPNTGEMGTHLKNMFENYKNYTDGGKRQAYYSKTNFSFEAMADKLVLILEENVPEIAKQVQLELPKLQLPKLQKIDG
jgi:glycosyltransferase involved in cell wall biosynthesis